MTKRQTAVEFAVDKLEKFIPSGNQIAIFAILKQAKQIEKEQIIDAVDYGCSDWGSGKDSEKYYNDTYGK
jgi:hypothetical protein